MAMPRAQMSAFRPPQATSPRSGIVLVGAHNDHNGADDDGASAAAIRGTMSTTTGP